MKFDRLIPPTRKMPSISWSLMYLTIKNSYEFIPPPPNKCIAFKYLIDPCLSQRQSKVPNKSRSSPRVPMWRHQRSRVHLTQPHPSPGDDGWLDDHQDDGLHPGK